MYLIMKGITHSNNHDRSDYVPTFKLELHSMMSNEPIKKSQQISLPLSSLLHDLALIRANDVDLNAVLQEAGANRVPSCDSDPSPDALEQPLLNSLEFISRARTVIKYHSSGELEKLGSKIERARVVMEDVLESLSTEQSNS